MEMKRFSGMAVVFLLLFTARCSMGEGWIHPKPIGVSKGGYSLRLIPRLGIELKVGRITLMRGNRILLRSRDFTRRYYAGGESKPEISTEENENSVSILISEGHRDKSFNYRLKLALDSSGVFTYRLEGSIGDVEEAHLQQDFSLNPALFAGAEFEALREGKSETHRVPFLPLPVEKRGFFTIGAERLIFDTHLGSITFACSDMRLFDFRRANWAKGDGILLLTAQMPEAGAAVKTELRIELPEPPTTPKPKEITLREPVPTTVVKAPSPARKREPAKARLERLIPAPRFVEKRDSLFDASRLKRIFVAAEPSPPLQRAVEQLREKLAPGVAVVRVSREEAASLDREEGIIIADSAQLAKKMGFDERKNPNGEQGYVLDIDQSGIVLAGTSERGTTYGVYTLLQLLPSKGESEIPCATIVDSPDFKFRGVHLTLRSGTKPDVKLLKDMFTKLYAPLKMNMVMLDLGWCYKYSSHPELSAPWALSEGELRDLVSTARNYGLEPIPCIQFFKADMGGNWICSRGGHMELAEDPLGTLLCPSHPDTYKLIFDIMDELIPVFSPVRFFHITGDELFTRGTEHVYGACERCRATGLEPYQLFARKIRKLHDHLAARKIRTIIWGDMLLDAKQFPGNSSACNGAAIEGWKAIPLIPKDVIIADWHYNAAEKFPTVKFLREQGFDVMPTPWYKKTNIYNLALAAREAGALGFLGSTWGSLGIEGSIWKYRTAEDDSEGVLGAYVLHAEYGWTAGAPQLDKLGYSAYEVALQRLRPSALVHVGEFVVFDLSTIATTRVVGKGGLCGRMPSGFAIEQLREGLLWVKGIPFRIGDGCIVLHGRLDLKGEYPAAVRGIAINRKLRGLALLVASLQGDRLRRPVLRIKVRYDEGSIVVVPVRFGDDANWLFSKADFVATPRVAIGRAENGSELAAFMFRWVNPNPEREISSIDFETAFADACPVIFSISGI